MVKIKSVMSSADSSDGESEALTAVRDKLKIQQRLIDISTRSLLNSRASSADLSQSFESQSALEVQRENSSVQEVSSNTPARKNGVFVHGPAAIMCRGSGKL